VQGNSLTAQTPISTKKGSKITKITVMSIKRKYNSERDICTYLKWKNMPSEMNKDVKESP